MDIKLRTAVFLVLIIVTINLCTDTKVVSAACRTSRFTTICGGFSRVIANARALRLMGVNPRDNICSAAQAWWDCLSRYNQDCSERIKAGHRSLIGVYESIYKCRINYN